MLNKLCFCINHTTTTNPTSNDLVVILEAGGIDLAIFSLSFKHISESVRIIRLAELARAALSIPNHTLSYSLLYNAPAGLKRA